MKLKLVSIALTLSLVAGSCRNRAHQVAAQPCDGPGPCNYPVYLDVPALSEKDLYCKYVVVKRIDCDKFPFALDCDELVCVECAPRGATCPSDSTDAAGAKFLKIKYRKDDYIIKLTTPSCSACTATKIHIYKQP